MLPGRPHHHSPLRLHLRSRDGEGKGLVAEEKRKSLEPFELELFIDEMAHALVVDRECYMYGVPSLVSAVNHV